MKHFVGKFKRRRDLLMDFCAGTCLMATTCVLLDQQTLLAGWDWDSDLLNAAEPDLILTFALQVLSTSSNTTRDGAVKPAAGTFTERWAVILARREVTRWEAPPALNATQVMLGHILYLHSTLYEYYGLQEKCRHIPLGIWSSVWSKGLHLRDATFLLDNDCYSTRVSVRRSTIQYAKTEDAVFARQNFEKKNEARSYYRLLA